MYRPMWPFLLMYGSHDLRHTGFRRLTVVNGTPGIRVSHLVCRQSVYPKDDINLGSIHNPLVHRE